MKKYDFTGETKIYKGKELKRIKRISDGLLGGWIEQEKNLSQKGDCFVYDEAIICEDAEVFGNAKIKGNAMVYGSATVCGDVAILENAKVSGYAVVHGRAMIYGDSKVRGNAMVHGNVEISDDVIVEDSARVFGDAIISESSMIYGKALVYGDSRVSGYSEVFQNAKIYGKAKVFGARIFGYSNVFGTANINTGDIIGNVQVECDKIEFIQSSNSDLITALKINDEWKFNIDTDYLITKEEFVSMVEKMENSSNTELLKEFYLRVLKMY